MRTTKKQLQEMVKRETKKQMNEQSYHLLMHDELERAVDDAITRLIMNLKGTIPEEDEEMVIDDLQDMIVKYLEGVIE